ncbi:MAG: RDD family protein, partial [Gaiellaceae bacterium]
ERALRGAGDRMLQSPEFERLLRAVLTSPEVRHALTRQTASLGADAAAGARRRTVPLDASAEATVHRWLRRPPQAAAAISYGGFVTRGLALVVDILLVAVMFAVGVALVNAVGDVLGGHLRPAWLVDALAGSGFALAFAVYFAGFWATAGQTPGMRLLGLRVVSYAHAPLGLGRSLVRLVALALSILLCFAGFLPALVDNRRRTLHDFLARTLVIYDERVTVD